MISPSTCVLPAGRATTPARTTLTPTTTTGSPAPPNCYGCVTTAPEPPPFLAARVAQHLEQSPVLDRVLPRRVSHIHAPRPGAGGAIDDRNAHLRPRGQLVLLRSRRASIVRRIESGQGAPLSLRAFVQRPGAPWEPPTGQKARCPSGNIAAYSARRQRVATYNATCLGRLGARLLYRRVTPWPRRASR